MVTAAAPDRSRGICGPRPLGTCSRSSQASASHAAEPGPANRGGAGMNFLAAEESGSTYHRGSAMSHSQQKNSSNRGGAGMSYNLVTVGQSQQRQDSCSAPTGSRQQVGNWSRIPSTRRWDLLPRADYSLVDLPGIYAWRTREASLDEADRQPLRPRASSRICCSTSTPRTWALPHLTPATAGAGPAHGGGAQDGSAGEATHRD